MSAHPFWSGTNIDRLAAPHLNRDRRTVAREDQGQAQNTHFIAKVRILAKRRLTLILGECLTKFSSPESTLDPFFRKAFITLAVGIAYEGGAVGERRDGWRGFRGLAERSCCADGSAARRSVSRPGVGRGEAW